MTRPWPPEPPLHAPDAPDPGRETAQVRPYTIVGGRTRTGAHLPWEAIVEGLVPASTGRSREERQILDLVAERYLSVAEISAYLHQPLGVARVLVADLGAAGHVRVHGVSTLPERPEPAPCAERPDREGPDHVTAPAVTLAVLESVLDGICAL